MAVFRNTPFLLAVLVLVGQGSNGCSRAPLASSDELGRLREQYLLTEEPKGAVGVLDARSILDGNTESVTVVGRIGGTKNPWSTNHASFMIVDPTEDAGLTVDDDNDSSSPKNENSHHGHAGHDPETCPFCRHNDSAKTKGLAIVQFRDQAGDIVPVDAREIFDIDTNQMVVVTGQATVDALGNLVIAARGLYLRR